MGYAVMVALKPQYSPQAGKFTGIRIKCALWNRAGTNYRTGEKTPRFDRHHLVCESGDYTKVTDAEIKKMVYKLVHWYKFDKHQIEMLGGPTDKSSALAARFGG